MATTFKNLTPHTLNIHTGDGEVIHLAPEGPVARIAVSREHLGEVEGVPFAAPASGEVIDLPPYVEEGIILVVSDIVAEAQVLHHRDDLAYPGELVRDPEGRPVGCRGLSAGPGLARRLKGR